MAGRALPTGGNGRQTELWDAGINTIGVEFRDWRSGLSTGKCQSPRGACGCLANGANAGTFACPFEWFESLTTNGGGACACWQGGLRLSAGRPRAVAGWPLPAGGHGQRKELWDAGISTIEIEFRDWRSGLSTGKCQWPRGGCSCLANGANARAFAGPFVWFEGLTTSGVAASTRS